VTDTVTMVDVVDLLVDTRKREEASKVSLHRARSRGRSAGQWHADRTVGWITASSYVATYSLAESRKLIEQQIGQLTRELPACAPGYARQLRAEIAGLRAFLRGEGQPW
jgi:hypothetical protein